MRLTFKPTLGGVMNLNIDIYYVATQLATASSTAGGVSGAADA